MHLPVRRLSKGVSSLMKTWPRSILLASGILHLTHGKPTNLMNTHTETYHPWAESNHQPAHPSSDEHRISEYLLSSISEGDSIATAISLFERFSADNHLGMTLGVEKGRIIETAVAGSLGGIDEVVFLEFGSHIGDATLRILNQLKEAGSCTVFSFEANQEWLGIGSALVRHVLGLQKRKCKFFPLMLTGDISAACDFLKNQYNIDHVHGVLFDHSHSKFFQDIQIIATKGLLREGTLILADNALRHQAAMSEFLVYMQRHSKSFTLKSVTEPYPDQVLVSEWRNSNSSHSEDEL